MTISQWFTAIVLTFVLGIIVLDYLYGPQCRKDGIYVNDDGHRVVTYKCNGVRLDD